MKKVKPLLTTKTTKSDILFTMSDNDLSAMLIVTEMLNDPWLKKIVFYLDELGIRGDKLHKFYHECCSQDYEKLKRTVFMLKSGKIIKEDLNLNLSLPESLPIIDDSMIVIGVPDYSVPFTPFDNNWPIFEDIQSCSFKERLKEVQKKDKMLTKDY
ncbi:MAG: hypothetical protein R3Y21_01405 [Mycoplasmatota bacterium]